MKDCDVMVRHHGDGNVTRAVLTEGAAAAGVSVDFDDP
jgi:hypothetical protein